MQRPSDNDCISMLPHVVALFELVLDTALISRMQMGKCFAMLVPRVELCVSFDVNSLFSTIERVETDLVDAVPNDIARKALVARIGIVYSRLCERMHCSMVENNTWLCGQVKALLSVCMYNMSMDEAALTGVSSLNLAQHLNFADIADSLEQFECDDDANSISNVYKHQENFCSSDIVDDIINTFDLDLNNKNNKTEDLVDAKRVLPPLSPTTRPRKLSRSASSEQPFFTEEMKTEERTPGRLRRSSSLSVEDVVTYSLFERLQVSSATKQSHNDRHTLMKNVCEVILSDPLLSLSLDSTDGFHAKAKLLCSAFERVLDDKSLSTSRRKQHVARVKVEYDNMKANLSVDS